MAFLRIFGIGKKLVTEPPIAPASVEKRNDQKETTPTSLQIPERQSALLLHGPRQPYAAIDDHGIPVPSEDREVLVKNVVLGLNPIDWKAPDFNFGIPTLPYVSGRELVGQVVTVSKKNSRLKVGDLVIVVSTDYRDLRKAAFQQYVLATDYNLARLPRRLTAESGSVLGVAFVAAAISLGICAGLDFSSVLDGPNLLSLVRGLDPSKLAEDIRTECLDGIDDTERARAGDWLAIWGGSSTTAFIVNQLARLAGLRTISILDARKHSVWLHSSTPQSRPDVIVDSHNPQRAVEIVRASAHGNLRFGLDTVGRQTAEQLLHSLGPEPTETVEKTTPSTEDVFTPPATPPASAISLSTLTNKTSTHLIGLTGLPKTSPGTIKFHAVPIKLFHEVPELGEALMIWLERLLEQGLLEPPRLLGVEEGLKNVNVALDRMRKGEISGGRIAVRV
ncbi:oxidoreductase [Exophiala viscosa]|uniref:Oxidoreductase n=1 Tax=Exophiala viscosa TaxID=2486360 RepID=A0AAN6IBL4_9EURO|nr:oxidoreductase [Exophiala viscosa]